MKTMTGPVARLLFVVPFAVSGLFHLANARAMAGMVPVPAGVFWVYFTGVALLAGAAGVASGRLGQWAGLGLAALMVTFVAAIHVPGLGNPETQQMAMAGLLKDLGLAGGALTWAGIFMRAGRPATPPAARLAEQGAE